MIAVGVDTHKDSNTAVALDKLGQVLGDIQIDTTPSGYESLLSWAEKLGEDVVFGLEGAGSWGAGLCEFLLFKAQRVFEVERPRRKVRRRGKSDEGDALLAAKSVLRGEGLSTPRPTGPRKALRALLVAYSSCVSERTRLRNQLQALHATAPIALRERVGRGNGKQLEVRIARMRTTVAVSALEKTTLGVLRDLAKRSLELVRQADSYETRIGELVAELNPDLLDEPGVGPISAAKLLVAAPERFTSEAAFARANGTAPLPASSGKTKRFRLSRSGDRQVNNALYTIALSRSIHHEESRAYIDKKIREGKSKKEALRALKRNLSRRLFNQVLVVT